ncbi:zinc-ribbon domain-containing protein [Falsiroseomonas stagni]|uniref:MJ0042 family finger-like domain-containing protein n=1 Tax=Falsiroseomonas stagni DSM 19981 TaxID=1123062 RepID=A0A1I4DXP1_9PROT|nr:zinc-ribbon domain-containing protein [Falsiroseomonas stagni]SFK97007.1 MJ0042 family finger-like domain-containing protein [Falsiroseomonas stagni DSM 19981]
MRIACPSCAAEYEVPDAALAAGPRMLRCARCSHQFEAALPSPPGAPAVPGPSPAAAPDQPPPEDSPPDRPPPSRGPRQSNPIDPPLQRLSDAPASPPDRMALAGWIMTVVVVGVGLYAGVTFRGEIMDAWPASARLYQALGLS